jgi:hypothetical protein
MSPHEDAVVDQVNDSLDPILKQGQGHKFFNEDYVVYPLQFNDLFATVFISTIPCSDTDAMDEFLNGRNYYYGGSVFDGLNTGSDRCVMRAVERPVRDNTAIALSPDVLYGPARPGGVLLGNYLQEYYCENGTWQQETIDCKSLGPQYVCKNYACVIPNSCNDSDGGLNYLVNGTMKSEGKIGKDMCRPDGTLGEYYCNNSRGAYQIKNCSDIGFDYYCANGECTNCMDSDGGINFEVLGTTSQNNTAYTDYCLDSYNIKEYYCNDNGVRNLAQDCDAFALMCYGGTCTIP